MKAAGITILLICIAIYVGLFVTWWNNPELTSMQMLQEYLGWQIAGIATNIVGRIMVAE